MNLGDIVVGQFPTRFGSMQLFPDGGKLLAESTQSAADQEGWFPNSIGQEAGRFTMKGNLPGRYYGPGWLAPNSGTVSVGGAIGTGNGGYDGPAAATLDSPGPLGPMTIQTPMPSVLAPRADQQTIPDVPCPIAVWVSRNPLLAIGAAALVYWGVSRGKR